MSPSEQPAASLDNYEMPSVTVNDGDDTNSNSDACQAPAQRNPDIVTSPTPIPPDEPEIDYGGLALVFLAPALGGFLYGYDIGATSFVLSMMRADRDHDHWWHRFTKVQQGLYVSCLALGALIGSHIVLTFLAQTIGRRKEIRIAATLYIVGAMLNVMSGTILATTGYFQWPPKWYAKNGDGSDEYYSYEYSSIGFGWGLVTLIAGRLLYGAGVGFIMHGAPTYMAEMSPSNVRGALVSAKETVIVFGIVVGMLMGDLQSDYPANWTDLYGYSILFAVPMLLLTFKIPRSKRWLLMKGYHEEARESMQFVYKGNVEDEFDRMAETINNLCCNHGRSKLELDDCDDSVMGTDSINNSEDNNKAKEKDAANVDDDSTVDPTSMWSSKYRKVMGIGMGLLLSQQFSGQPCVLAYSRVLFEAAGWAGHTSVITVTIMGIVSSFTVTQVDRLGRKSLLAAGSTIMLVAVSCLAFGFWGWDENLDGKLSDVKKQLVLWSMFIFISGYQIGFGPISWTVLSEIYPTEIRGSAMALSVEVNFFAKFLIQFLFPVIQEALGWGTTFIVFAFNILTGLLFVLFKVPETKGMTLEEIQVKLKNDQTTDPSSVFEMLGFGGRDTAADSTTEEFQYANMDTVDKTSTTLQEQDSAASAALSSKESPQKLNPIV
mmetsp:Transcript_21565/g.51102  ORF Transcript_21565/g.51102 Transcript_21565/m.51102 type:complete len:660 (-) Transcript_21565:308-2287(-)